MHLIDCRSRNKLRYGIQPEPQPKLRLSVSLPWDDTCSAFPTTYWRFILGWHSYKSGIATTEQSLVRGSFIGSGAGCAELRRNAGPEYYCGIRLDAHVFIIRC